jgi:hypothetical protein
LLSRQTACYLVEYSAAFFVVMWLVEMMWELLMGVLALLGYLIQSTHVI